MAYDDETRYRLKRQICRSMPPSTHVFTHRDGRLTQWFINKLEGLAAYAYADKNGLKKWELDATRLCLVECRTQGDVAEIMGVDQSSVSRAIRKVLDCVVTQMPEDMARAVLQADKANWKFGHAHKNPSYARRDPKSDYHCVSPLFYDPDVAGYAEWCCSLCSYREAIGEEEHLRKQIRKEG